MNFSFIIPNFNGKILLESNLPKFYQNFKTHEFVIVDDASTDDSVVYIKKNFPTIKLIEKVTNSGFATSINLGFKAVTGEIAVLLNTDVVPHKDFLNPLELEFADPLVFAVGCLDESLEDGKIILRGRGIGTFSQGFLAHQRGEINNRNTLWASGGSSAFRVTIWHLLGGMDEAYDPFYWEDIDLSYRALKSGYKILFAPKSIVAHKHNEGSIRKHYSNSQVSTIAYRNQFLFFWKNVTSGKFILMHLLWLPIHILISLKEGNSEFIKGFLLAVFKIFNIFRTRKLRQKLFVISDEKIVAQFSEEFLIA